MACLDRSARFGGPDPRDADTHTAEVTGLPIGSVKGSSEIRKGILRIFRRVPGRFVDDSDEDSGVDRAAEERGGQLRPDAGTPSLSPAG